MGVGIIRSIANSTWSRFLLHLTLIRKGVAISSSWHKEQYDISDAEKNVLGMMGDKTRRQKYHSLSTAS